MDSNTFFKNMAAHVAEQLRLTELARRCADIKRSISDIEFKRIALDLKFADTKEGAMVFGGYGAVFGNVDAGGDMILPGAFVKSIERAQRTNDWPAMMLQHGGMGVDAESLTPIGLWTKFEEDAIGLIAEGTLADIQRSRDVHTLMKMKPRPAINGLSIGYIPKDWSMRSRPEEPRRTLKEVDLIEVSIVTSPMNPKARVLNVKSGDLTIRDAERALRDVGYTQSEAKTILALGYKSLSSRDADEELAKLQDLARLFERGAAALTP